MNLTKDFIPDGLPCDTGKNFPDGQPSVITIHWVGPFPGQTPSIVRKFWVESESEASAHFIVKDEDVLQCWPIEKIAWHAGCLSGNTTSLGIEVIPANFKGKFSEKTIETLKELLDTLPRLPLVRHYDWTGKDCPKFYTNYEEWNKLLEKLGRPKGV